MKLSELLKNNPEVSSGATLPSLAPLRPKTVSLPVSRPVMPQPSSDNFENKIREGVEKEFFEKMRSIEAEMKRMNEERLNEHQRLMQEQQKTLEFEKQRLTEELKALKAAHDNLSFQKTLQEQETQKRLAEERERLRKELEAQSREAIQKQREEFREQIAKKEKEILEERKYAREVLENSSFKASEELALKPAENKISEKEISIKDKDASQQLPPPIFPEKFSDAPISKPVGGPSPESSVQDVFILDTKTEERLRKIYQTLAQVGTEVFEKLLRSGSLESDYLNKLLSEIYDLTEKYDQDFLMIVLEPYPTADYFSYHAANCAILSTIVGQELKMSATEVKELALASFVHDVGLLGIRENLDYPKPLTSELKSEILKHPERGAALLGDFVSPEIITAVLQHHETINGKGYPKGLVNEEIHAYAKIMQVVDAFEAMTHHRPYRQKPFEVSEALREMVDRGRGVYDRAAMKSLMSRIGLYPVLSMVELSNHKIARVVRQSRKFPLSPIVRIEFDEDGNKLKTPFLIDLSKNQLIHIHAPVGSGDSYGKERIEKHSKPEKRKTFQFLELIPFLLVLVILAAVAYIILKL